MWIIKVFFVLIPFLELVAPYPYGEDYLGAQQPSQSAQYANIAKSQTVARYPELRIPEYNTEERLKYDYFRTNPTTSGLEGAELSNTNYPYKDNLRVNSAHHEMLGRKPVTQQDRDYIQLLRGEAAKVPQLTSQQQKQRASNSVPNQNYFPPLVNTVAESYLNAVPVQNPLEQNTFQKVRQVYPVRQRQQYYPLEQEKMRSPTQRVETFVQRGSSPMEIRQASVPVVPAYPKLSYAPIQSQSVHNTPHGYNLQHILSTNPLVKDVLATTKHQKRYLVVHPDGKVEHVDEIETIAQKHPNYILVNGGTLNLHANKAPTEIVPVAQTPPATSKPVTDSTDLLSTPTSFSGSPDESTSATIDIPDTISHSETFTSPKTTTNSETTSIETVLPHETTLSPEIETATEAKSLLENESTSETADSNEATNSDKFETLNDSEVLSKSSSATTSENKMDEPSPKTLALPETSTPSKTKTLHEPETTPESPISSQSKATQNDINPPTAVSTEAPILFEVVSPPETSAIFETEFPTQTVEPLKSPARPINEAPQSTTPKNQPSSDITTKETTLSSTSTEASSAVISDEKEPIHSPSSEVIASSNTNSESIDSVPRPIEVSPLTSSDDDLISSSTQSSSSSNSSTHNVSKTNSAKENTQTTQTKATVWFPESNPEFWDQLLGDHPINVIYFFFVPSKSEVDDEYDDRITSTALNARTMLNLVPVKSTKLNKRRT